MIDEFTEVFLESLSNLLSHFIMHYFTVRGLKWPTTEDALLWMVTELGEAVEIHTWQDKTWVRNNPQQKDMFTLEKFGKELGDVIFMSMVAGLSAGVNPMEMLLRKMYGKLEEIKSENT